MASACRPDSNMGEESEATIPPLDLPTVPEDVLSPQQDGNKKPQQILSDVVVIIAQL